MWRLGTEQWVIVFIYYTARYRILIFGFVIHIAHGH